MSETEASSPIVAGVLAAQERAQRLVTFDVSTSEVVEPEAPSQPEPEPKAETELEPEPTGPDISEALTVLRRMTRELKQVLTAS